ncbi:MAG: ribosome silencing factor [Terracidiphilus sp.]
MTTDPKQQTRILVQAAAQVCEEKKGSETRILELDPIDSGLSDFFLLTSATNDRQATAIADEIELRLKKNFGVLPNSVEGRRQAEWILLDYVDFVVHVFLAERRAFYDIERLRKSARPLTPAEFDAELKAELAARTRAARSKAGAQARPVAEKTRSAAARTKTAARTTTPESAGKQPAGRKAPAKKAPAKAVPARKAPAKKAPARKVAARKSAAKKAATR